MIRIIVSKSAERATGYYTQSLASSDYFLEQQRIPSQWMGLGAERLGLLGEVTSDQFASLCHNRHPDTDDKLTPRDGAHRRVGYDVNFHCPKSVSLAYAMTNDAAILEAFHTAVDDTMTDAERMAHTLVRTGSEKSKRMTGNLVWGRFTHLTARPVDGIPDPHLHAHCFVFNATWDAEETRWKACEFTFVHQAVSNLEKRFHERLVTGLKEAGYPARMLERYSEVELFSEATLQAMSRRTREIDAKAQALGIEDAKEKDQLGRRTRKPKETTLSWDELRSIWAIRVPESERAKALAHVSRRQEREALVTRELEPLLAAERESEIGKTSSSAAKPPASTGKVKPAKKSPPPLPEHVKDAATAIDWAIKQTFGRRRSMSSDLLVRKAYAESDCRLKYSDLKAALKTREDLFRSENTDGSALLTTADIVIEERRVLDYVEATRGKFEPISEGKPALENSDLWSSEQHALKHILQDRNGVAVISGFGSVQNQNLLEELMLHATQNNFSVTLLTAKQAAADQLAERTPDGDASRPGLGRVVSDVQAWWSEKRSELLPGKEQAQSVWQFLAGRASIDSKAWRHRGHVVVLDDAAALSVGTLADVIDRCRQMEAKLVATGDKETRPFTGGGNNIELLTTRGGLRDSVIERKKFGDRSHLLEHALDGFEITDSLDSLVDVGKVVEARKKEGMSRIGDLFAKSELENRELSPKRRLSVVVTATTPEERDELTDSIRESMREKKLLGNKKQTLGVLRPLDWDEMKKATPESYRPGQVIRFNRKTGVFRSGEEAEVLGQSRLGGVFITSKEHTLPRHLPLERSENFTVMERDNLQVRPGDKIRLLAGGLTRDKEHRLDAGEVHRIKSFTRRGDLKLTNGWVVDKDYAYLEYGYVTNLSTAKGMKADLLLASGYGERSGYASRERFMTAMTSGRDVLYYTPSIAELERGITREAEHVGHGTDVVARELERERLQKALEKEHGRDLED